MIDYKAVLSDIGSQLKEHGESASPFLNHISSVFVPHFDESFGSTKNRVVIVGQESRGWQKRLSELTVDNPDFDDMISRSRNRHKVLYESAPGKSKFLQYVKRIKDANQQQPVQWLNFYMCDYKRKSFNSLNNSKRGNVRLFEYLRDESVKNLSQQLTLLKPRVIFFVGGYHNNFPLLQQKLQVQSQPLILKQPVEKLSLSIWNNQTLVLRLPHPSARSRVAQRARVAALQCLKNFDQHEHIESFKASLL